MRYIEGSAYSVPETRPAGKTVPLPDTGAQRARRKTWRRARAASPLTRSPSLRDGNMKQAGQPPLRAGPRLRAQLAEHLGLRLGPPRPRAGQGSSSLVRDLHRLDSPVGMRSTLEQPIPLQEAEAASVSSGRWQVDAQAASGSPRPSARW